VGSINWLSKNRKTNNILKKIEKILLDLKIPYFLVQIIMYIIIWVPLGAIMYFGAWFTSDYLKLW